MKFAQAQWLWFILLLVPIYWIAARDERSRLDRLALFTGRGLWNQLAPQVSPQARITKLRLLTLATLFALLALARPQLGMHEESAKITGLDVLVALDVSASMETEDVVPSRLKKAQHLVRSLLGRIPGDRVGVLAFAGGRYLASPLTTDH